MILLEIAVHLVTVPTAIAPLRAEWLPFLISRVVRLAISSFTFWLFWFFFFSSCFPVTGGEKDRRSSGGEKHRVLFLNGWMPYWNSQSAGCSDISALLVDRVRFKQFELAS